MISTLVQRKDKIADTLNKLMAIPHPVYPTLWCTYTEERAAWFEGEENKRYIMVEVWLYWVWRQSNGHE